MFTLNLILLVLSTSPRGSSVLESALQRGLWSNEPFIGITVALNVVYGE